jgi:integrase
VTAGDGIDVRHRRVCRTHDGGRCNCTPGYRASVYDAATGRQHRRTFPTRKAAQAWRLDAMAAIRTGALRASSTATVREVAERWLREARAGVALTRSGDPYKPAAVRDYERNLRLRVLPAIGDRPFAQVRRGELQRLVNELQAAGLNASTIGTTILPLRAMFRDALAADELDDNPTRGLRMPAVRGRRDRYASPQEAAALLAALEPEHRAVWATAMYAGLRRGELVALRWEDVDLAEGVIRVRRGWDAIEGEIAPKSREGRRTVPIPGVLRGVLLEHRMRGEDPSGRVFGGPNGVTRAVKAAAARWDEVDLPGITLHECRHTYASLMIAAGVNAKALQTFLGHANIAVTMDRYGHLMPGSEAEAAGRLDAYLDRARAVGADVLEPASPR